MTATLEQVTNLDQFDEFQAGSYYTITGAGGPLQDWMTGLTNALQENEIGTPTKFYTFKGKQMNEKYELSGKVAYDKDLTFLVFPLDNLDVGKLAMFKLRQGDRWFDDIVANNAAHMKGW